MDLESAEKGAEIIRRQLMPATRQSLVCGSIRRRKPQPKDVEIVCEPEMVDAGQRDLFAMSPRIPAVDGLIDGWLRDGTARPRLDRNGRQAIGSRYKRLEVDVGFPTFIPLDLFIVAPPAQWGLQVVIRTGSDLFARAMLARWKLVSGGGYSEDGCLHFADHSPYPTLEEADVFRACQVSWIFPSNRIGPEAVDARSLPVRVG